MFLVALGKEKTTTIVESLFFDTNPAIRFLIGLVSGVAILELTRRLAQMKTDAAAAIAAFFFSLLGTFLLYFILNDKMQRAQLLLFGIVVAGGIDIILLGMPKFRR